MNIGFVLSVLLNMMVIGSKSELVINKTYIVQKGCKK